MADVVSEDAAPAGPHVPPGSAEEPFFRGTRRDVIVNPRRFGLAYLVLAIGMGAAVGLAIVLLGRGSTHHIASGAKSFTPERSGELGARQIGDYVSHEYNLPSGRGLVGIIAQRPSFQNVQMNQDLIRPSDSLTDKDVTLLPLGNGIMYLLCGLGANCAIDEGADNPQRNALVEQEVMELAVRTFKSDSAVQTVTLLMPPFSGTSLVAVVRRRDFAPIISRPLSAVIPNKPPYVPGDVDETTARALNRYLLPVLFTYQSEALGDGTTAFVLNPYPRIG